MTDAKLGIVRVPHDWQPSKLGHGEQQCRWCQGTNREIAVVGDLNHCPTRASLDPKYSTPSGMPSTQWGARADIPLNDLIKQMHEMRVGFAEIPMGPYAATIVITPMEKQPLMREAIAKVMKGNA